MALEIFSFDKTRFCEFLDVSQERIKDALFCVSLSLEFRNEFKDNLKKLEDLFFKLKNKFEASPFFKGKFELYFRSKDKQVSFDFEQKDGKLVQALLDLGINLSKYHKFNFVLKTGINLKEILDQNVDKTANFVKVCSILFSIKSETDNAKYLTDSFGEALKDLKLNDEKKQKKLEKFVEFINFINSFIGFKCEMEYDAKVLAEKGVKEAGKTIYDLATFIPVLIYQLIEALGLIEFSFLFNSDSISINIGVPKYQNGYYISIKIPGLAHALAKCAFVKLILGISKRAKEKKEDIRKKEEEEAKKNLMKKQKNKLKTQLNKKIDYYYMKLNLEKI